MKNQYFGDINDYRKYGLLRALQTGSEYKLLVAWMLTQDDGRSDGGFRDYFQRPKQWRRFDPELYDGLAALLRSPSSPRVSLLEGAGLLPRSTFHSVEVPDARTERDAWRRDLLESVSPSGADLVFFDPDNGIEVPSRPMGCKGSSKYLTWQEVQEVWAAGCSVLIYQHFPRKPREAFAASLVSELRRRAGDPFTAAFRTAHVLFLLAAQARHEGQLREAIDRNLTPWRGEIDVMTLDDGAA